MIESKDAPARLPGRVRRDGRTAFVAWLAMNGSHGIEGRGATAKEAMADLELNAQWVAHYVGAFIARDGEGSPWIVTVAPYHGTWLVRRLMPDGMSSGSCMERAPSYSAICAQIARWNKPEASHAVP